MYARFYEQRPAMEEELESEDPGMRALAKYFIRKKEHRELQRSAVPSTADHEYWTTWWDAHKQAGKDVFELWKKAYDILDGLDDWIYAVENNIIGTFYVRTVQEAVDGLARFAQTPKGRLVTSEKVRKKWKLKHYSPIRAMCVPIKLGSKGFIIHMG